MKKVLPILIVLFVLRAQSQTDSSELDAKSIEIVPVKLPRVSALGAPIGQAVSKEIGAAGGKIISDDQKLELIFPAGALDANVTISIQPVVNSIPNGNSKAYQFEPSGIQFKKPVSVIFHYSNDEAASCPPDLRFMAIQDHTGKWEYTNYEDWDSTIKTLKGSISHFSAFLDGMLMDLSPNDKTIKVGNSFPMTLSLVTPPNEDELTFLPKKDGRQAKWVVKGFGTLSYHDDKYNVLYNAPAYLSSSDPQIVLTISETTIREVVQRSGKWRGTTRIPVTRKLATFTCNVHLYDEYKITVIHDGPSGLDCGAELTDRSFFQAKLFTKKIEIGDVINSEPTLTKLPNCSGSRGGRGAEYKLTYDNTGCQGPVHVDKTRLQGYGMVANDKIVAAPNVTIQFAPNMVKIMIGTVHMPAVAGASTNKFFLKRQKTIPGDKAKDEPPEAVEDINVGNKIEFIANRARQEYMRSGNGSDHDFQLIIEPI